MQVSLGVRVRCLCCQKDSKFKTSSTEHGNGGNFRIGKELGCCDPGREKEPTDGSKGGWSVGLSICPSSWYSSVYLPFLCLFIIYICLSTCLSKLATYKTKQFCATSCNKVVCRTVGLAPMPFESLGYCTVTNQWDQVISSVAPVTHIS